MLLRNLCRLFSLLSCVTSKSVQAVQSIILCYFEICAGCSVYYLVLLRNLCRLFSLLSCVTSKSVQAVQSIILCYFEICAVCLVYYLVLLRNLCRLFSLLSCVTSKSEQAVQSIILCYFELLIGLKLKNVQNWQTVTVAFFNILRHSSTLPDTPALKLEQH